MNVKLTLKMTKMTFIQHSLKKKYIGVLTIDCTEPWMIYYLVIYYLLLSIGFGVALMSELVEVVYL